MNLHEAKKAWWEREWAGLTARALTEHGITILGKTIGALGTRAVWLITVQLKNGVSTVQVLLPPGVTHYSEAALYLAVGEILAKHGPEGS